LSFFHWQYFGKNAMQWTKNAIYFIGYCIKKMYQLTGFFIIIIMMIYQFQILFIKYYLNKKVLLH